MSNFIRNGHSISLSIPNGESIAIAPLIGIAWAVITAGVDRGTVLLNGTNATGKFGPYTSGAVILLTAGPAESLLDFDIGLNPVNGVLAGSGGGGGGTGTGITGDGAALYRQIVEADGIYKLQKNTNGAWIDIQNSNEDGTTLTKSVATGVGSFHLGEYHSIGSGGQNVMFINHETNLSFYPGVWQAESLDGLTVVPAVTRVLENSRVTGFPNGTGRTGFAVPYTFTLTPTTNVAFYSVRVRLEEAAPNGYTWVATSASGKEFMRVYDPTPRLASNYVTIQFEYPVYLRVGDVANIRLSHGRTGPLINCTAGTTVPTEPWRETRSRRYIDVPIDRGTQKVSIPAGSDDVTRYPLARPESRILRISGTTPSVANKSILIHAGVNLFENYLLIANISATGAGEAFSIDVDVPMAYRYIYFRKDFTDSVNALNITVEACQWL